MNGDTMLHANRPLKGARTACAALDFGAEGLILRTSDVSFIDISLAADGAGGAYVVWKTIETSSALLCIEGKFNW